jgi:hypothetical protein
MMQPELNSDIAQKLFENIAVYPIGSLVRLSTGDRGIVVDVNKEDLAAPVVRIIKDQQEDNDQILEVDLMHNDEIIITEVITDNIRSSGGK